MKKMVFLFSLLLSSILTIAQGNIPAGVYRSGDYYRSFSPDTTVFNASSGSEYVFPIDLNNDSINDVEFRSGAIYSGGHCGGPYYYYYITALDSNKISLGYVDSCQETSSYYLLTNVAKANEYNDIINAGSNWVNMAYLYNSYCGQTSPINVFNCSSDWGASDSAYIGVRVAVGARLLYGWILINRSNGNKMPSYACESIFSGIETASIDNNIVNLYPDPAKDDLTIETNIQGKWVITIYDLEGKQVITKEILKEGKLTFDTSELKNGIYILNLRTLAGSVNKKLIIAR